MKHVLLVAFTFGSLLAHACDDTIKAFPRDCAIQDRYVALKAGFAARQIDIDEIAEYRVIRFVGRSNWERAKSAQIRPDGIYEPAPATWEVWDSGIREVMNQAGAKNQLFENYNIDEKSVSLFNRLLLENDELHMNIKDKVTDPNLLPGEMRKVDSNGVGFVDDPRYHENYAAEIANSEASMARFQARWESLMGNTLSQMLRDAGVEKADEAAISSRMSVDSIHHFVNYAPSAIVRAEFAWIKNFIRLNLEKYKAGTPVLSPLELATVVQKWFVSVHPFSDGNGRTSRAIQDVILANFGMPFVPGGDLQEDATAVYENYIDLTYKKTEAMLSALELCQTRNAGIFQCQTIAQINATVSAAKSAGFQKAQKKD